MTLTKGTAVLMSGTRKQRGGFQSCSPGNGNLVAGGVGQLGILLSSPEFLLGPEEKPKNPKLAPGGVSAVCNLAPSSAIAKNHG